MTGNRNNFNKYMRDWAEPLPKPGSNALRLWRIIAPYVIGAWFALALLVVAAGSAVLFVILESR